MERRQKLSYYYPRVSRFQEKLEEIRSKPYNVRQRLVFFGAFVLTMLLVGGIYLIQFASSRAKLQKSSIDELNTQSPFSVIGDTWKDMVRYAERASEGLIPNRDIFNKKSQIDEGLDDGFINHPGVDFLQTDNSTE